MKYIYLNNYITDDNKIYRDILRNASIRMDWRNFLYISFAKPDDDTKYATLLSYHRSGGLHRLIHSVATRTSYIKRFGAISISSKLDRNCANPPERYRQL